MALDQDDQNYLQLLSIFHYVIGILALLVALLPLIYSVIGWVILSSPEAVGADREASVQLVGWLLVILPMLFLLFGLVLAVLMILNGRFIARRVHHSYCIVVSAAECLFFPLGTVLGVLSLVVLLKEEVKQEFNPSSSQTRAPAQGGDPQSRD